jgi:hypothetical protein
VSDSREDAVKDLQQLLEATKRLRADLRSREGLYRRTAKKLARGTDLATAMKSVRASDARGELAEAFDDFEYCRHQLRLSMTSAGLDEGMTIGHVGKALGISRQLAARYAKETRHFT